MDTPFDLKDRTVLITGASSGIGRQTAISVSAAGARVVLVGRNTERLRITLEQLQGSGHTYYTVDITDEGAVEQMVSELPALNGVVHAAGILAVMPFKIQDSKHIDQITTTNYIAPVNLTRRLLNSKKLQNGGSVVFITSVNGTFTAVKGFSAYAGAKAALNSFSKVLALEYASRKIRVNTIAPGMIKTEMLEEMTKTVSAESVEQDKQKYPLGDYGDPEDVANAAIYLLSAASKWVTGTALIVDGGLTIA